MKRICLFLDGSWNKPDDESGAESVETNVRIMSELAEQKPDSQTVYYDAGVGTQWYDRIRGGLFGVGLGENIRQAYEFLVETFEPGDEVFGLGFSRGAYTLRSLAGMLRACGLLSTRNATMTNTVYELYRSAETKRLADLKADNKKCPIKMLGCFDTVGAMGVPLGIFKGINERLVGFHDTTLSPEVSTAYHAIAIDEQRDAFEPSLWHRHALPHQTIEQNWFAGAHADIGGGYPDRHHSDVPLMWMIDNAAKLGMEFGDYDSSVDLSQLPHDSHRLWPGAKAPRTFEASDKSMSVHPSVMDAMRLNADYHPIALTDLDISHIKGGKDTVA